MIRLRHRMLCGLAWTISALLFLYASAASAQCTKDTECKGERVCQAGVCLAQPEGSRPAASAGQAPGPGAPAGPTVPANGVTVFSTVQPSGAFPAYICQPVAGYIVPTVGYGVPGAALAVDAPLPWPNSHNSAFVRLTAGLGYMYTGFDHNQDNYNYSETAYADNIAGTAITLGIAVGGSVSRNLVVFGELQSSLLTDPSVDNGDSSGRETWDGNYGLVSIGPGVSYYFEQSNMYLSGALSITRLFGQEIDSEVGKGINLSLGKEWRTSAHWGIGVAGGLQAASANDKYRGTTHTFVPSLRFSASWN